MGVYIPFNLDNVSKSTTENCPQSQSMPRLSIETKYLSAFMLITLLIILIVYRGTEGNIWKYIYLLLDM